MKARDRRLRPQIVLLEPRFLLSSASALEPSADEQYMLQLVNRARANPQAEGTRLANLARSDPSLRVAIGEAGILAFLQEIQTHAPVAPLAFNPRLIASSRLHDAQMLAANSQFHSDLFSLVQPSQSTNAPDGLPYFPVGNASWSAAENVFAYSGNLSDPHGKPLVDYFHAGFLLDWGNPNFGHLRNLLNPGPSGTAPGGYPLSEVGIGILTDVPPTSAPSGPAAIAGNQGLNVGPALVTQQFAWRSGHQFLTGAIFSDGDGDHFYTPGEGLGGVLIQAVGRHGEGTFTTTAWGSGGYSLDLPSGVYDVAASGGGLANARSITVTIGADNVGWDVMAAAAAPPTPAVAVPPSHLQTSSPNAQKNTATTLPATIPTKKQLAASLMQRRRRLARLRLAMKNERIARSFSER